MILVTGATGNIGRPLIELLQREGARVRGVTRTPHAAALPAGVEVVYGDPSRPETMAVALQGVTRLMVGNLGDALGRPLRYQEIPPGAAKRVMIERGFPFSETLIDRLFALLAKAVGQPATTTDEVERILGRPALTYARWASDHAAAFRRPS